MLIRGFILSIIGLCGCAALNAQTPFPAPCVDSSGGPGCTVGSAFSVDFSQFFGLSEIASLVSGSDGVSFMYYVALTGNAPPGLTLNSNGVLSGVFAQAGDYAFTVTLN